MKRFIVLVLRPDRPWLWAMRLLIVDGARPRSRPTRSGPLPRDVARLRGRPRMQRAHRVATPGRIQRSSRPNSAPYGDQIGQYGNLPSASALPVPPTEAMAVSAGARIAAASRNRIQEPPGRVPQRANGQTSRDDTIDRGLVARSTAGLSDLVERHPVAARSTVVATACPVCFFEDAGPTHFVPEGVEPKGRFSLRFACSEVCNFRTLSSGVAGPSANLRGRITSLACRRSGPLPSAGIARRPR
jgi:hypothetical protein